MNTNELKTFAQEARKKLMQQVAAKMEYVLGTETALLLEKKEAIAQLNKAIQATSKKQVAEKVAYTWFNRFMALRFMDVNDYQPLAVRIISPKDGFTLPQILEETKQGIFPKGLKINQQLVNDLIDGKVNSNNPQNEAFRELLIAACNHLNTVLPFLFEKINDYTELLLPDDLISEFSIIQDVCNGMTKEDCQEVEIIGWIYQFYISERKDEVFASKSKVSKEDIPAATQLFTPRWIVEYMVQNTLGKLWLQNKPNSQLRNHMPYFIESPSLKADDYLKVDSIEEVTLLDQASGSGHILVYAFELFTKIYKEEGYTDSEIPQLIISKNLHGFEIDERAAQLASFALMMKAREDHRRIFRKSLKPNILCYQDLELSKEDIKNTFTQMGIEAHDELYHDLSNMQQATNLGSLIIPHSSSSELNKILDKLNDKEKNDVFLNHHVEQLKQAIQQLIKLSKKHHCIVDNPPYMGWKKMNKTLSDFVKKEYPKSKADLMACFMEVGLQALHPKGFLGMINQHSWMFTGSYVELRKSLINEIFIDTLLHLGPRTFPEIGGEIVQNSSFTIINQRTVLDSTLIRLVDYNTSEKKRQQFLTSINQQTSSIKYLIQQTTFRKIESHPIIYWLSEPILNFISSSDSLSKLFKPMKGFDTGGQGDRFMFVWWESSEKKILNKDRILSEIIWVEVDKGGEFRKWYGNKENIVRFGSNGATLYNKPKANIRNKNEYFKNGITFSVLSNKRTSFRISNKESIFYQHGAKCVVENEDHRSFLIGYLNSKIALKILGAFCPTLTFTVGDVGKLPVQLYENKKLRDIVNDCVAISENDYNNKEVSRLFKSFELLNHQAQDLEESYDLYCQYWTNKFHQLHKNEEELNKQFIEIYGLEEELTPDVPLKDITILKQETAIEEGELVFYEDEVMAQFMSYAVGCMFGRYSLDKEGLILANQGESLEDYLRILRENKVETPSFMPDDDNIIPVLDGDWFEDDIVGRFKEFLKITFGKADFDKNLTFLEECLGRDVRSYFIKDFYKDHIRRYKKRPIYWMFSSAKGSFNVLVYMHRYNKNTIGEILKKYLLEYRTKLQTHMEGLDSLIISGTSAEQTRSAKEKTKLEKVLLELKEYERDILYPLASERISIDLDDGVLVNYNKFGSAIKSVAGLNDKKAKAKVRKFDWIETEEIRD